MSRHVLQNKKMPTIQNEQGTAIVVTLLILLLLTFVAISSVDTTISEKAMVRSEAVFEQDFYKAESAAMEGVQKMVNATLPKDLLAPLAAAPTSTSPNKNLLRSANARQPKSDLANLDTNADGVVDNMDALGASLSNVDPNTYHMVIQMPIASGNSQSLTQTNTRLYTYTAYGLSEADRGRAMVKIGFKKQF